ncbi:MAG: pentapeptide repeat-containing protein, partial [Chloroflexi bacterium]
MRIDEGSREEHAHQSDKVEDVQRKKDNLQGSSREGIFATPALNSATGQAHLAPWRTEPEIGQERQEQLSRYLATTPDITRGIYPFKGVKLSRADVEWLLAAHENGRGPTAPSNEQQDRQGLDLRGADLRYVDLHAL